MTLDFAFDLYIKDKSSYVASHSIYYYKTTINEFIKWLHSQNISECSQLTKQLLIDYSLYLQNIRNIKNTSVHTYFRAIKNFCSWLIDEEIIEPFKYKIKLPRPDPELVLPLSQEESVIIFEHIQKYAPPDFLERDLLIVRLMLDMGLRSSEVRHLKLSDIDFNNNFLVIRNSKYNKSRTLPIPSGVISLLNSYIFSLPEDSTYLFNLSEAALKSFFARLKAGTGIERLHPHLLRHTFATSYMTFHSNLEYLRLYMGHSSYSVTQRYLHISSELLITHFDIYKIDDIFI